MRTVLLLISAAMFAAPAAATLIHKPHQGARIQGNAKFYAAHQNANARGSGESNQARNSTGVIRAGARIQGNTAITASQDGATAVASGRGNTAANEAGVIGGR